MTSGFAVASLWWSGGRSPNDPTRRVPSSPDSADVCVVGAGAAGLALAHDLARRGHAVRLLDAGGSGPSTHPVRHAGRPHRGSTDGHALAWGGTTTIWGGQLWPWEPHEFEARPDLGLDGWPIGYDDVAPFYPPALRLLGVRDATFGEGKARELGVPLPPLDPSLFAYKYSKWAGWRARNLGRTLGRDLLRYPGVTVERGARAVAVETDAAGRRVTAVRVREADGTERSVRAETFVLAGGVLGTVRLLLASRPFGGGLGNEWVGRGFMDHLSVRAGRFTPRDPDRFERAFAPFYADGVLHTPRVVPQPDVLEAEGLLGCYGHWELEPPPDSGPVLVREALRALQAGRRPDLSPAALRRIAADVPDAARLAAGVAVQRRRLFPRGAGVHLRVDVEQPPDAGSVLRLEDAGARPGDEALVLDWRVSDRERRSVRRLAELLGGELDRLGVGTLDLAPDVFDDDSAWGGRVADAYHMMGGTRMSPTPETGVVDPDARVHGVENLFVAGASVFPTGGMANPTLTLMALALRLGSHLSARPR